MKLFADNIRKRAATLGLSNAEVARRTGLTERRYGNYVTGRREPDLTTLVRIAETLQVGVEALLIGEVTPPENAALDRLKVAAQALSSDDLERLVIQAEALAVAAKKAK